MCGFSVIISRSADKKDVIEKMNRALIHRGPDHEAYFEDENVVLGHRRLAIIDLSEASNQPMMNEEKDLVLVFNGVIYNYKELRSFIDYPYKSSGDTEVILALYKKYGDEFIDKIDGIFSFCLYDIKRNVIIIARDRMGQKPLYYQMGSDYLILCSEIRPLLKTPFFNPKIDLDSFQEYLRYKTVNAPNTIIQGVKSYSAACYSIINIDDIINEEKREIIEKPYWEIDQSSNVEIDFSYERSKSKLKELFVSSVEKRLIADVKLGIFLSGGVDSTAIVGAASALSDLKMDTFSIDFKEEGYSEKKYADLASKCFDTKHHTLSIDQAYFSTHFIEGLNAMDHPSEDGLNNFFISKFAKEKGISVALSGLGGDELFAGYYVFDILKKLKSYEAIWKLPNVIKKAIISSRNRFKQGEISRILEQTLLSDRFSLEEVYPYFRAVFDDNEFNFDSKYTRKAFLKSKYSQDHFISTISVNEMSFYMQSILLRDADCMSMASSLELRSPFLDSKLVEYTLAIPDSIKGYNKSLLLDALDEFIPNEIKNRNKKGFVVPIQKWIVEEEKEWFEKQIKSILNRDELKLTHQLSDMYNSMNRDEDRYQKFWHLAVLEHWISVNLDRA